MGKYYADSLKDKKKTYFLIRSVDDDAILPLPTKYLKHKMNERCSRNTLKKIPLSQVGNKGVCSRCANLH